MIKKIFTTILFLCLLFSQVYSNSCGYDTEIEICKAELSKLGISYDGDGDTFISTGVSVLADYSKDPDNKLICAQGSYEYLVFQITMDMKFREVDKQMDQYLDELYTNKDEYFAQDGEKSYYDGITNIWEKSSELDKLYSQACVETYSCMESISNKQRSEIESDCYGLKDLKIEIFNEVAFNILLLNKQQVLRDEKKLFEQETRTKYNELLDLMMINLGYIERIRQKWPSKTANAK